MATVFYLLSTLYKLMENFTDCFLKLVSYNYNFELVDPGKLNFVFFSFFFVWGIVLLSLQSKSNITIFLHFWNDNLISQDDFFFMLVAFLFLMYTVVKSIIVYILKSKNQESLWRSREMSLVRLQFWNVFVVHLMLLLWDLDHISPSL